MSRPTDVPGLGPASPLSMAGPLLVRARLADVRRYEAALLGDGEPDPDAVHDMRVAARRLRAALELLGDADLLALERQVKALQDALGAVRDVQVQRAWLAAANGGAGGGRALADAVDAERPRLEKKLHRALRAWVGAIAPAIERSAAGAAAGGKVGGKKLGKVVRRGLERAARRVEDAAADPAPRAAHRLRIAVKKVRYATELVRPGRPEAAERLLSELVPLQERLGDLHDTDVRVERLADLAASGPARARGTARRLLEETRRDRVRQERALRRELERWRAEGLADELAAGFASPRKRGRAAIRKLPASGAGTAHA